MASEQTPLLTSHSDGTTEQDAPALLPPNTSATDSASASDPSPTTSAPASAGDKETSKKNAQVQSLAPSPTSPSSPVSTELPKGIQKTVSPYILPADRRHTVYAITALVSSTLGKMLSVLPPLAIKYAVDSISSAQINIGSEGTSAVAEGTITSSTKDASKPILQAILAYFAIQTVIMLNGIVQDLAQRSVALDAERRFASKLFAHLHNLSLSYHLENHIGEITRIMNRGSDSISTIISSFLFYLTPTLLEAIFISTVFWKLVGMPSLAFSTLAAIALYLGFTIFVTKTRIVFRRKLIEASDAVGQKEVETLVNYETVSMFGRTNYEIEQYAALRHVYKERRVEMLAMFALLEFGQKFIKLSGTSAGLVIAGLASVYGIASTGEMLSPGTFVIVQMYIQQLFQPLTQLGWQYRMITQAVTDLEKAAKMLNREPEVQDSPNAIVWKKQQSSDSSRVPTTSNCCDIVFSNVTFQYKVASRRRALGTALTNAHTIGGGGKHGQSRRGRLAMGHVDDGADKRNEDEEEVDKVKLGGVKNINFTIDAGKTVALVGPSGSGKTTIVRLVLRVYDPDEGKVSVDSHDVKELTQESLRQNIGVVAQDTILFNCTLRENIMYGKQDATDKEVWNAVRIAALESFVLGLPDQLDTLVGERGMKLSGGERQRVGLARCIVKDPQLILLDEATSALDTATEREIQDNIARVCRSRTTLMIAHRLSTARHADEILVLDKGAIIERGNHNSLIAMKGSYAAMWNIQNEPTDEVEKKEIEISRNESEQFDFM